MISASGWFSHESTSPAWHHTPSQLPANFHCQDSIHCQSHCCCHKKAVGGTLPLQSHPDNAVGGTHAHWSHPVEYWMIFSWGWDMGLTEMPASLYVEHSWKSSVALFEEKPIETSNCPQVENTLTMSWMKLKVWMTCMTPTVCYCTNNGRCLLSLGECSTVWQYPPLLALGLDTQYPSLSVEDCTDMGGHWDPKEAVKFVLVTVETKEQTLAELPWVGGRLKAAVWSLAIHVWTFSCQRNPSLACIRSWKPSPSGKVSSQ